MTRQSVDRQKLKDAASVEDQVKAFFAAGGKIQELPHGESGDGKRAFTISPARKDLPVKP